MMNVGDSGTGIYNVTSNVGNNGVCDIVTNGRNGQTCAYCKFLLEAEVGVGHYSNERTHVNDLKNLVEVQLPGGDRLLVVLRVETPRDSVPFTPLV